MWSPSFSAVRSALWRNRNESAVYSGPDDDDDDDAAQMRVED